VMFFLYLSYNKSHIKGLSVNQCYKNSEY